MEFPMPNLWGFQKKEKQGIVKHSIYSVYCSRNFLDKGEGGGVHLGMGENRGRGTFWRSKKISNAQFNSTLSLIAVATVLSSIYSKLLPTGKPIASLETITL